VPEPAASAPAQPAPVPSAPSPSALVPSAPVSAYRLQLRTGFGFAGAAGIAGYLADLGVSHVYLSPILAAVPGSAHGYDVVDHSLVSPELGGEAGFGAMVETLRGHGLGVVVDVVPNHMAIPVPESLNKQLWSLLGHGRESPYAHWFDVDWAAAGGRFLLPVLAGPPEDCAGDLRVDTAGDEPVLRYFDHVLPVRDGTAGLPLPGLLAAQHYRLASWRDAATQLNWRRFFDVTSLIAVRVEDPDVFEATHRVLLRLVAAGLIDGLRVDHPDGLADPRGYLRRLAAATGGAWVAVEKILAGGEHLPPDWPCAGTTGYDALGVAGGLFLDRAGAQGLTGAYLDFTRGSPSFGDVARQAKRQTARRTLAAEVSRLARLAAAAGDPVLAGASAGDLSAVLAELLAAFGVYRAYVVPGEPPSETAAAEVVAAAGGARRQLPPHLHPALAAVAGLVLGEGSDAGGPRAEFVTRFQQTCGPVMAKGVEDTAFYRWSRLVSLNEVGGEPDRFGTSPEEFHEFAGHLARSWPHTLTTLSTHDTKRQEDVRARLATLAEFPSAWARQMARWHEQAAGLAAGRLPEPDTEYLLWQTLAGAWPLSLTRLTGYLTKVMREAKTATSWTDPDEDYEAAVLAFAEAVLADPVLAASIESFAASLAPGARVNSLGAKLVQLTMPGVPDVYQGCELAGLSLVDPDNRRPVDFALRRRLLAGGRPDDCCRLDTEKLLVTASALRLRRDHPDWFCGGYQPVEAAGPAHRHAFAFARGSPGVSGGPAVTVVTRLPAGLAAAGGWRGTVLPLLQAASWRDVISGTRHPGPRPPLAEVTRRLPVALLIPEGAGEQTR
jgi:(1->4)-alpha-D-glucan 1-alpha-D-glucosylmutase